MDGTHRRGCGSRGGGRIHWRGTGKFTSGRETGGGAVEAVSRANYEPGGLMTISGFLAHRQPQAGLNQVFVL
jgi:hypothetical protein